jgi:hypothetical protein
MKKSIIFLLLFHGFVALSQQNIGIKGVIDLDIYDLDSDDLYYPGGKIFVEKKVYKNLVAGLSFGYNESSINSRTYHYGIYARYYFGKACFKGFFTELAGTYNPFKLIGPPPTNPLYEPDKTKSILIVVGFQNIFRYNITYGMRIGGGIFGPYQGLGIAQPPMKLTVGFEIGYLFYLI